MQMAGGTTVPFHGSREIAPSLLRKIARDVDLTVEQLLDVED
jgi:predicted RNA binding protein YcfA (HicA-like mRNA interferase family)